jgi:hypothetical protein
MAKGMHKPIIEKQTFDCVQKTLQERNHKTRQLRCPNYLSGLVRCGKCGAPMHVTYPGTEPKTRFKYYVCNNRYNFKACDQAYVRADMLERSVIKEIEKLSTRKDVISALVRDFEKHNRHTLLPELEQKKGEITKELNSIRSEKENKAQERLWTLDDEIGVIQQQNYNASVICSQLKEFVKAFRDLQ